MVSYSPSIVTMAVSLVVSQIFGIKEWPDLAIWVWGRSMSFKMARLEVYDIVSSLSVPAVMVFTARCYTMS